ncbi:MAG: lipopolysaccharide assembly protein LapA domain-containing protein [Candidatus Omnitrophica bacterium]|nr:lipopolysaccharide assembly protein LapA domain-containing protein [Candidatus Omnitrophota bacterium]
MRPRTIAILFLSGLLLIVFLQNTQVVSIRFLFWKLSMSRIIFLPLLIILGFIAGFFTGRKSVQ